MPVPRIPLFKNLGKALAKQIMPEELLESAEKATAEEGAKIAPKLPATVLGGVEPFALPRTKIPIPEPQPLSPTTRVQQLAPEHAEIAARIEMNPAYLEKLDDLGAGRRVTHEETWARAFNAKPMTVDELAAWSADKPVNEVQIARAGLLRRQVWDRYFEAMRAEDDQMAMEMETLIEQIEPGYNSMTATPGRATEFQKVFQEHEMIQNRVRQLRAAGIPYATVREEMDTMLRDLEERHKNVKDPEVRSLLDRIETYATAAKLTSPITHAINSLSNSFTFLQRGLEKNLESLELRRQGRHAEADAAAAHAWGTHQGFITGARKFLDTYVMKAEGEVTEPFAAKLDWARPRTGEAAIPWEKATTLEKAKRVGSPFRLLEAADNFWKAIIYDSEMHTQALAQAKKDGLEGEFLVQRVQHYMENAPQEWKNQAWNTALEYTYQDDPGTLVNILAKLQRYPGGRFIIPFIKTPANILRFQARRSPLGLLSKKNIADWKAGGPRRAEVVGRMGIGLGLSLASLALYHNGEVTGAFPEDPQERSLWEQEGRRPWSIKVNNHWLSYNRAQPLGLYLMQVAAVGEAMKDSDFSKAEDLYTKLVFQVVKGPMEMGFLQGMSALMDAISDPERSAKKFGHLLVTGFIPNVLRDVRNQVDPATRKPETLAEAIENMLPGFSQEVNPRVSATGRHIESEPNRLLRAFKQSAPSLVDEVTTFQRDIGWAPLPPPSKLTVRGKTGKLDGKNYENYMNEMGEATLAALQMAMRDPTIAPLDKAMKRRIIARVVEAARNPITKKYQALLGLYGPEEQAAAGGQ